MTDFILTRNPSFKGATIGELTIAGRHICYTLEDVEREEKIPGETCIPRGRYQIKRTFSQRFGYTTPELLDVPNFTGIRFHPGNKPEQTRGCILPGRSHGENYVSESQLAYREFLKWLDAMEWQQIDTFITITGKEPEPWISQASAPSQTSPEN